MKKLRIAQVAPLWFTVPPKGYGGIERVIKLLADGLVDRGHDVTLFASPGSDTKARLISVYDAPLIEAGIAWSNPMWNLRNIQKAVEEGNRGGFDVIHMHLDVWGLFAHGVSKAPVVHTMHNPLYRTNADATKNDRLRLFREEAELANVAFISEAAKRTALVELPRSRVVYNGIDLAHFRQGEGGDHYIWIARIDKHKGIENAIDAAEKLGAKLTLAGRIDPSRQEYFDAAVKPRLNDRITFIGELTQDQLPAFYGSAKAMLYPIEWEEPFGLVVAEAMACGTPVVAYARGSMKELIADGVSGYAVPPDDLDAFAEAMRKAEGLDRGAVRKHVEEHFSAGRMTEEYERFYNDVIASA